MGIAVSVVVATYGPARWRRLAETRAIPSVAAQTSPPVEVLAVHGDTLHAARNTGASDAVGDWLCFLDADDELDPGYLEAMAAAVSHGELLQPATSYVDEHGNATEPSLIPAKPLLDGNYLVIGTLVPRRLFLEVGGFTDWPLYEDWDLWLRCTRAGARVAQVPRAVYRAHVRGGSRNRPPLSVQRRYFEEIREQYMEADA